MPSRPSVTVVMPAYNAEPYIGLAISSILAQTYRDFELWVIENGSSDRTAAKAREFDDPRIKVFELGPVGFQGALGYALEHAESKWIARMDADDVCLPARIEKQMKVVSEHPEYVMVGSTPAILTPFGHIIERSPGAPSRELSRSLMAVGRRCADPSMLFNRKVALDVGGYDPEFMMGDVPLWLRMLEGRRGWEIAENLYVYRLLPMSLSKTHSEGILVREKYTPELARKFLAAFPLQKDSHKSKQMGKREAGFWQHIAFLELLAGDYAAVVQCANRMQSYGARRRSILAARARAYARSMGRAYYARKCRFRYRHRPDWERHFPMNLSSSVVEC